MRIATGKLFARHNDGYAELWVMGDDGVRPARPSDFKPDAETVRRAGDVHFSDEIYGYADPSLAALHAKAVRLDVAQKEAKLFSIWREMVDGAASAAETTGKPGQGISDPFALAAHLKKEARRLGEDGFISDEALALAAIEVIARDYGGVAGLIGQMLPVHS